MSKPKKFEIFISYRRKGGYDTAKLLYDRLRIDGYSVFFDIDALEKGDFDNELEQRVCDCKDFLLVLNSGVFDRFFEPEYDSKDDWLRQEIVCALEKNKNIVPLILDGFAYPKNLPEDIKSIAKKNGIDLNPRYFENAYANMKQKFLVSKPGWAKRNKKIIISFLSLIFFGIIACIFFLLSDIYEQNKQKDLQLRAVQKKLQLQTEKIAEQRIADPPPQPIAQKEVPQKPAQKPLGRSVHWSTTNDIIGAVIYEKLEPAGVKKSKCSGNGIILKLNKPNCKTDNLEKIICTYSPKLNIADCNDKPIATLGTSEIFNASSQESENDAKEELANELRSVNFDDWVSAIEKF